MSREWKFTRARHCRVVKLTFGRENEILTKNLYLLKGYDATRLIQKFSDVGFQLIKIFYSRNRIISAERRAHNTTQ